MSGSDESADSSKMPRGLTLEQAKLWGAERRIKELSTRLDEVVTLLNESVKKQKKKSVVSNTSSSDSGVSVKNKKRSRKSKLASSSDEESDHSRRRSKKKDDDRGLRLDVPEFYGNMTEPEKYLDWVRRAETLFNYKDYNDRKKLKVAECKLAGYAGLWYDNLKKKRAREGRDKIRGWEQLKKHMRKKFIPSDYVQGLYLKLQSFKQGNNTVEQYLTEFEKMCLTCDLDEKDEYKTARFVAGLNEYIQDKVDVQPH